MDTEASARPLLQPVSIGTVDSMYSEAPLQDRTPRAEVDVSLWIHGIRLCKRTNMEMRVPTPDLNTGLSAGHAVAVNLHGDRGNSIAPPLIAVPTAGV